MLGGSLGGALGVSIGALTASAVNKTKAARAGKSYADYVFGTNGDANFNKRSAQQQKRDNDSYDKYLKTSGYNRSQV